MRQFFYFCCCVGLSNLYHSESILESLCSFYGVRALDRGVGFMALCSSVDMYSQLFFPTFL